MPVILLGQREADSVDGVRAFVRGCDDYVGGTRSRWVVEDVAECTAQSSGSTPGLVFESSGQELNMRVAAFLLPLVFLAVGCAPNRGEWTAKNEALLARLPHYPGSTRVATQTLEIEEGSESTSHVVGYSTHVSYRPPPLASARAIVRFFVARLRREGWRGSSTVVDGVPMGCFTRGRAFVSILTDGMVGVPPVERTFELGVNHDGGAPAISC